KTELVHRCKRPNRREVSHLHIPRQRRSFGENRFVADMAIMINMRIRHEQTPVPYRRFSAASDRPAAHRHIFAKSVSLTDNQFRLFAMKFQILRIAANRTKWMKHIAPPNSRRTLTDRMRIYGTPVAQSHVLANNRIRSDFYLRPKPRARGHDSLRMNLSFSLRTHKLLALGAECHSTASSMRDGPSAGISL